MRHRYKRSTKWAQSSPSVDLTPLIDVVFVILIMFIVVAPLLEIEKIQLAEGGTANRQSVKERGVLSIHVKADNTVYLNQAPVGIEVLGAKLKEEKRVNPDGIPQLFHDKGALFGTYQAVKHAAESAGFPELELVVLPAASERVR